MTDETNAPLLLVLCKGANGSRVAVDLESFLKFNAQMDYDLKHLVDSWSDFATPNSRRRTTEALRPR